MGTHISSVDSGSFENKIDDFASMVGEEEFYLRVGNILKNKSAFIGQIVHDTAREHIEAKAIQEKKVEESSSSWERSFDFTVGEVCNALSSFMPFNENEESEAEIEEFEDYKEQYIESPDHENTEIQKTELTKNKNKKEQVSMKNDNKRKSVAMEKENTLYKNKQEQVHKKKDKGKHVVTEEDEHQEYNNNENKIDDLFMDTLNYRLYDQHQGSTSTIHNIYDAFNDTIEKQCSNTAKDSNNVNVKQKIMTLEEILPSSVSTNKSKKYSKDRPSYSLYDHGHNTDRPWSSNNNKYGLNQYLFEQGKMKKEDKGKNAVKEKVESQNIKINENKIDDLFMEALSYRLYGQDQPSTSTIQNIYDAFNDNSNKMNVKPKEMTLEELLPFSVSKNINKPESEWLSTANSTPENSIIGNVGKVLDVTETVISNLMEEANTMTYDEYFKTRLSELPVEVQKKP